MVSPPSREDRISEPGEEDEGQRTRFERDRDAIIYTRFFRRLDGVTQVVSPDDCQIYHNRLTHTIEVAQIAQRIAEHLKRKYSTQVEQFGGLDPAVVESAALAHDLGHPPFGHIGEKTLNDLVVKSGNLDGYEGNAQAFRIVTRLAIRPAPEGVGLNLTRAVLNAILKYPWKQDPHPNNPKKQKHSKWGAYTSEAKFLQFARQCPGTEGTHQSLEAEIMDWADDIAYSISDTEDFYRAGLIPLHILLNDIRAARQFVKDVFNRWEENQLTKRLKGKFTLNELGNAFLNLLKDQTNFPNRTYQDQIEVQRRLCEFSSNLIGRYIEATELHSHRDSDGHLLKVPREYRMEIKMLKELTWQFVIKNSALASMQFGQKKIIDGLFTIFKKQIRSTDPDHWDILPARDRDIRRQRAKDQIDDAEAARLAADAIAGMTDHEALLRYQRLTGTGPGGAFETWAS